jgi:hypothetical protein
VILQRNDYFISKEYWSKYRQISIYYENNLLRLYFPFFIHALNVITDNIIVRFLGSHWQSLFGILTALLVSMVNAIISSYCDQINLVLSDHIKRRQLCTKFLNLSHLTVIK